MADFDAAKLMRDRHTALVLIENIATNLDQLHHYTDSYTRQATAAMIQRLKQLSQRQLTQMDAAWGELSGDSPTKDTR